MKRLGISIAVLLLVMSASSFAQDPDQFLNTKGFLAFPLRIPSVFNFTGSGARAQGMGKAFLAVSDDVSALSWNPAGLYGQEKPMLGFSYGTFAPDTKFDLSTSLIEPRFQSYNRNLNLNHLKMLSFLAPIRIKGHPFVVAASYSRTDDEYDYLRQISDFQVDYTPLDDDTTTGLYRDDLRSEYQSGLDVINFGFGTRLHTKVSFGVSANIYTNKSITEQLLLQRRDGVVPRFMEDQAVLADTSLLALDTSRYSGINFTVGFKYAAEKWTAGLVFKSPFSLEQSTNRTIHLVGFINGKEDVGSNIMIHFDNIITKIDIPLMIGGGVSYNLTENLLVTADGEYRPFSGGVVKLRESFEIVPGEKDRETFSEFDPLWKDVFTIRTGAEYVWNTGSTAFPVIPIRAGFSSVPLPTIPIVRGFGFIPILEEYYEPDLLGDPAQVTATSFSFGTGIYWTQIHIDFAYTYTSLDRNLGIVGAEMKNTDGDFNFTFSGVF